MNDETDTAGVIAPPPLLGLIALIAGLVLSWLAPLGLLEQIAAPVRYGVGAALILLAIAIALFAVGRFSRAGTPVQTRRPSTNLVTAGVFAHVRNPIYVGFHLLLLGIAFAAAADWLVVTTFLLAPVIHFGVVLREERYLERKFGEEYRLYKARVPRYGWRL